jgi:hypothetical protein
MKRLACRLTSLKLLCDRAAQQPIPVLGKHRVVPYRIVHAEADEPAWFHSIAFSNALRTERKSEAGLALSEYEALM